MVYEILPELFFQNVYCYLRSAQDVLFSPPCLIYRHRFPMDMDVIADQIMRCRIILQNVRETKVTADLGCTTTSSIKFSHMIVKRRCLNWDVISAPDTLVRRLRLRTCSVHLQFFSVPITNTMYCVYRAVIGKYNNYIIKD